ncbi:Protein NLP-3 [Aphelenchoides avenae]|nr:Protein NLP-3 [Aphelenchus avenae]
MSRCGIAKLLPAWLLLFSVVLSLGMAVPIADTQRVAKRAINPFMDTIGKRAINPFVDSFGKRSSDDKRSVSTWVYRMLENYPYKQRQMSLRSSDPVVPDGSW